MAMKFLSRTWNIIWKYASSMSTSLTINLVVVVAIVTRIIYNYNKGIIGCIVSCVSFIIHIALALALTAIIIISLSSVPNLIIKQYQIWLIFAGILWLFMCILPVKYVLYMMFWKRKLWFIDLSISILITLFEIVLMASAFNYIGDFICQASHSSTIAQKIMPVLPRFMKKEHHVSTINDNSKTDDISDSFANFVLLAVYENKKSLYQMALDSSLSIYTRVLLAKAAIFYTNLIRSSTNKKDRYIYLVTDPIKITNIFKIPQSHTQEIIDYWNATTGVKYTAKTYAHPTSTSSHQSTYSPAKTTSVFHNPILPVSLSKIQNISTSNPVNQQRAEWIQQMKNRFKSI